MTIIEQKLFDLLFTEPSTEAVAEFIEGGHLRQTDGVPNIFEGMPLNCVLHALARCEVIAPEYREKLMEMGKIADEACRVEEEFDNNARDAVTKHIKKLGL
ncbi:hypothetical protein [Phaeobacter piscinae]|uniref:Uncharacterized protein n=1 Tax=Phaeobacter piscinae TaxID=1580596 RepID=A0AAN1GRE6_9RHOB|nr:hypothetical protein [Phaeobacter piscinae]ATG43646.1 hypothetical protein PhaeoP13_01709 [Phaeobacter piscinae]